MLAFVLWLLLGLLAVILVVLATPVLIRIDGRAGPAPSLRIVLRLLGGLTPPMVLADSARAGRAKPRKAVRTEKPERKVPGKPRKRFDSRVIGAVPRLIGNVLGKVHFDELNLDAEFGLGDPAATGEAFGMMTPLLYGLPPSERVSLAVRPDFERTVLSGRIGALIRVTPLAFVPPAIRFGWVAFGPAR